MLIELATAIKARLDLHEQASGWEIAVAAIPNIDRSAIEKKPHVMVLPRGIEQSTAGRGMDQQRVSFDIAIRQQCTPSDLEKVAELVAIVESISDWLNRVGYTLVGVGGRQFEFAGIAVDLEIGQGLAEQNNFIGVVSCAYIGMRSL